MLPPQIINKHVRRKRCEIKIFFVCYKTRTSRGAYIAEPKDQSRLVYNLAIKNKDESKAWNWYSRQFHSTETQIFTIQKAADLVPARGSGVGFDGGGVCRVVGSCWKLLKACWKSDGDCWIPFEGFQTPGGDCWRLENWWRLLKDDWYVLDDAWDLQVMEWNSCTPDGSRVIHAGKCWNYGGGQ